MNINTSLAKSHHEKSHGMASLERNLLSQFSNYTFAVQETTKFFNNCYYYYNHFTAPWTLSGTTRVSWYQKGKTRKVKTNLDILEQETVSGSGISWAICKSASRPTSIPPLKRFNKQNFYYKCCLFETEK